VDLGKDLISFYKFIGHFQDRDRPVSDSGGKLPGSTFFIHDCYCGNMI